VTCTEAPGPDGIERALVVMAHPDDVDFGAAGTIATWTDAGIDVSYCMVTSGDAGGFDDTPRDEMTILRQKEQRAAAAAVGVRDVTFLGFPDGALYVTHELRKAICREIRRIRPQRVLCQSPEWDFVSLARGHPDHRAAGAAALDAVYPDARNPFAHPELLSEEGLAAWTVNEVWINGGRDPERYVDITGTFDRKISALREHVSQVGHVEGLADRLRGWSAAGAREAGLPEGRLVERFTIINAA
jgi:LmbE family N-acetylglucosaminyl deacetylase